MDNNRAGDDDKRSELNRKTGVLKVGITAKTEEREALGSVWRQKGQKVLYGGSQLRLVATSCDQGPGVDKERCWARP